MTKETRDLPPAAAPDAGEQQDSAGTKCSNCGHPRDLHFGGCNDWESPPCKCDGFKDRAEPMWPDAPLPPQLQAKVDAWLKSNLGSGADFYHGTFPLGFVTRWIERAECAEGKLAAANVSLGELEREKERLRRMVLDAAVSRVTPVSGAAPVDLSTGRWNKNKFLIQRSPRHRPSSRRRFDD